MSYLCRFSMRQGTPDMHPNPFFQVRDSTGTLHLINAGMIARVEVRGPDGILTGTHGVLDETGITPGLLEVQIVGDT